MGNIKSTINTAKDKWVQFYKPSNTQQMELKNMEKIFRTHLCDYIKSEHMPNEEIKIILYLSDFYDLLDSPVHKGYMQIYEKKIYNIRYPDAPEELIKFDREIDQYLYKIINSELNSLINIYEALELLIETNYVTAEKLTKNIHKVISKLDDLEGDDLTIASKQLTQMIRTKRSLVCELTENNLIILSDSDMQKELTKINDIILKCHLILKTTRHVL